MNNIDRQRETETVQRGSGREPFYAPYYGGAYYEPSTVNNNALIIHRTLSLLRRRWLNILLGILFGLGAAGYKLWTTPKIYQASSMIKMRPRRPRILQGDEAVLNDRSYTWKGNVLLKTRLHDFKGIEMRKAVIRYLKDSGDREPMRIGSGLFFPISESFLVTVTCRHTDPERAAISANAYAAVAEQMTFQKNKEESRKAVAWLQEQATNQRKAIEEAADLRIKFMSENQIDLLEHQRKTAKDKLAQLSSRLVGIQSNVVLARDLCNALDKIGNNPTEIKNLPTSAPRSSQIHERLKEWRNALADRESLRSRYRDKHPKAITAEEKVLISENEVLTSIKGARKTAHTDMLLQIKQSESLESEMSAQRKIAAELELKLIQIKGKQESLSRAEQASEATYRGLLRRIEEARLSADENTTTVSVVKKAVIPRVPSSPKPRRMMMMGLIFGLILGGVLAFLKEMLDDPVTSTADVENSVELRVLGLIPRRKKETRAEIAKETIHKRTGLVSEAFAGIRATLRSVQHNADSRSLLITSTAPGDGKTIVASNLAITFARHGAKTLLIDFDLRRPRIQYVFSEAKDAESLTDVLRKDNVGVSDFENLVKQTDCENLDVIVTHSIDKNASATEIVGADVTKSFLDWAKSAYDQVIIDSPPHGLISDAGVLAGQVSGVILVCWADRSRKHSLRHAVQHLSDVGANVLGVVINSVKRDMSNSYGRYDYYHKEYDHSRYV